MNVSSWVVKMSHRNPGTVRSSDIKESQGLSSISTPILSPPRQRSGIRVGGDISRYKMQGKDKQYWR